MNLVTLATDSPKWRAHAARFVRTAQECGHHTTVIVHDQKFENQYLHFDRARMALPDIVGGSCVYYDPDVDIVAPIDDITDAMQGSAVVGWCRSPENNLPGVVNVCTILNVRPPQVHANIGCLVMKRSIDHEWAIAEAECRKVPLTGKMTGSVIFNVMLSMFPGLGVEIPYEYDVLWHDIPSIPTARAIHFCNDWGKIVRPYYVYSDEADGVAVELDPFALL